MTKESNKNYVLRGLGWDDEPEEYMPRIKQVLEERYNIGFEYTEKELVFEKMFSDDNHYDFVILDLIKINEDGSTNLFAGYNLASIIRNKRPNIPVFFITSDDRLALKQEIRLPKPKWIFSKQVTPDWVADDIVNILGWIGLLQDGEEQLPIRNENRQIFIGHGHSEYWKLVKHFLVEKLDLRIFEYDYSQGQVSEFSYEYIVENLRESVCAILFATKDEFFEALEGVSKGQKIWRTRQNVIHEIGLAQGTLGRVNTVVVADKEIEIPTNISGIGLVTTEKGIEEVEKQLISFLSSRNIIDPGDF